MFSPIIRSTWLYLQYLVVFTQVAAGWCFEWTCLGDVFAHHQEHLTVFTVSGSVHPSCCRLVFRMNMFRAMFSPIIRSTWLYLQYLVVLIQVAVGWCLRWVKITHNLYVQCILMVIFIVIMADSYFKKGKIFHSKSIINVGNTDLHPWARGVFRRADMHETRNQTIDFGGHNFPNLKFRVFYVF
jgi:hypothetical protein